MVAVLGNNKQNVELVNGEKKVIVEVDDEEIPEQEVQEKFDEEQASSIEKNVETVASVADNLVKDVDDNKTKIVVFGDSIWADSDAENDIYEQIMDAMNVEIYNCAIGGTSAAVETEPENIEAWDSKSFNGMVYVARGYIDAEKLIPGDKACEIIQNVNFEEIDYVIVSYGINDYFLDIPVYPKEYYDMTSYVGALRHGIKKLQKQYPNIEVILTSPTYCEWFKGERQYELGTYTESARSVAEELELHFLDMYHALGKNPDEKMACLEDGVHLNDEGLTLYANWVIEYLKGMGIEEN